jgi:hypothetical protein
MRKKTIMELDTINEDDDIFKDLDIHECKKIIVVKKVNDLKFPTFTNKKSIFGMKQNELVDHFITTLKQNKSKIAIENNLVKVHDKLDLLAQSIGAMMIYKEMRKIISMSFESDEEIPPEKFKINNVIIDDKCRLTLLKCIERVDLILCYDTLNFREVK